MDNAELVQQRRPPAWCFWLSYACFLNQGICYTIVIPTIGAYTESVGGTAAISGLMVGVFCISGGLANIPTAWILLRVRMKTFIVFALVLYVIGNALVALAGWANSLGMLLAGRVVIGLVSMNQVSGSYIARCFEGSDRSERMVLNASASGVGCAIGPALSMLGSVLCASLQMTGELFNQNTVGCWLMAVVSGLLAVVIMLFFTEPPPFPKKEPKEKSAPFFNVRVFVSLAAITRVAIVLSSWETHVEVVAERKWGWSDGAGAAYLSLIYAALIPATMYGKNIAKKMSDAKAMKVLSLACLPFLLLLLNFWSGSALGVVLYTTGSAVMVLLSQLERGFPQSAITKAVAPESQQAALSAFAFVWSFARAIGSSLGTLLYEDISYVAVMLGVGILEICLLAFVDRQGTDNATPVCEPTKVHNERSW